MSKAVARKPRKEPKLNRYDRDRMRLEDNLALGSYAISERRERKALGQTQIGEARK